MSKRFTRCELLVNMVSNGSLLCEVQNQTRDERGAGRIYGDRHARHARQVPGLRHDVVQDGRDARA